MSLPDLGQPVPRKDITIKKNQDFTYAILYMEDSVITNTTGWTVKMQVREIPDSDSPVLMEASTAGGSVTVGINGAPGEEVNIDILVPAATTNTIGYEGTAGYDIRVVDTAGNAFYIAQGYAYIQGAYTY